MDRHSTGIADYVGWQRKHDNEVDNIYWIDAGRKRLTTQRTCNLVRDYALRKGLFLDESSL